MGWNTISLGGLMYHNVRGFSLIELMIVIAIIGILIALAAPSYQNYTRRAHYAEIVQATAPYKIGVEECYQTTGDLNNCDAGKSSVPPALNDTHKLINHIEVRAGMISITPNNHDGIKPEDNYILTPTIATQGLSWQSSGGGVVLGYAR